MSGVRLISYSGFKAKGIPYSKSQINRLINEEKFPKKVELGLKTRVWLESEIDAWIAERIAARDRGAA